MAAGSFLCGTPESKYVETLFKDEKGFARRETSLSTHSAEGKFSSSLYESFGKGGSVFFVVFFKLTHSV